jgi:hypothetical protein
MAEKNINAQLKQLLSKHLTAMVGDKIAPEELMEVDPEVYQTCLATGDWPGIGELLVRKILRLALSSEKANQWAVELVFDRLEGRAGTAAPPVDTGRVIEDRLDGVTTDHLNSLAKIAGAEADEELAEGADRPTAKLLEMSAHRDAGS